MDSNKDKLNLGQLISKLRKEKGYSQRKFAQISGLSNATISRIENGETTNPDSETLKLLSLHLDYPFIKPIKSADISTTKNSPTSRTKLKFLQQPVRKIARYSTVHTTFKEEEEEQLHEHTKEQIAKKPIYETIALKGMRLITLRLEKKISQKELADALDIDKTLISQYEGETNKPTYDIVQRMADFLGVTVDYLTDNPESEVIHYQEEPKDLFRNTSRDHVLLEKGLRPEYMTIAEEIQDAGIEVEDVRAFIELIKKYKG